jgi:hypothetical protein
MKTNKNVFILFVDLNQLVCAEQEQRMDENNVGTTKIGHRHQHKIGRIDPFGQYSLQVETKNFTLSQL